MPILTSIRASTMKIYIKNRVETLNIVTFEFFFVIQDSADSAAKIFHTKAVGGDYMNNKKYFWADGKK